MIQCVTLDKDGNILLKEEKCDSFRPLNGFERAKDGNFYKQIGDPRCISEKEFAAQQELKNRAASTPSQIPVYVVEEEESVKEDKKQKAARDYGGNGYTRVVFSMRPVQSALIKFYSHDCVIVPNPDTKSIDMYGGEMLGNCGIKEYDLTGRFSKIEISPKDKTIGIWKLNYNNTYPDVLIVNAVE